MGWWKLEAWKKDANDKEIELDDADLEHIAECIKDGFTQGEVVDGDVEETKKEVSDGDNNS